MTTLGVVTETRGVDQDPAREFVRLRIELPDHPGALAAVSRALAGKGLNVVDVSIHEVDGHRAVDEIVVHCPLAPTWAELAPAITAAGAELLSIAPCDMRSDPVVAALTWVTATVGAPNRRGALQTGVRLLTGLDNAQVFSREEASQWPIAAAALTRPTPLVARVADVPPPLRPQLRGADSASGMWVLAVPDGPRPDYVVLAARPYAVRFTATEINRLLAVLDCRSRLMALHTPAADGLMLVHGAPSQAEGG